MKKLTQRFGNHVFEPSWKTQNMLLGKLIDVDVSSWLFEQGSLTRRIQKCCNKTFSVKVLSQKWLRPMLNEAIRLQIKPEQRALIREVLLYCGDTPWVFARSVLPAKTLTGPRRFLGKLGNRPLGEVLFSDPDIYRDELEVACITKGQRMFSHATDCLLNKPEKLWGRRSVFHLYKKPLLVNEIFLPEIALNKNSCTYR